jgi:hypothetical protein
VRLVATNGFDDMANISTFLVSLVGGSADLRRTI